MKRIGVLLEYLFPLIAVVLFSGCISGRETTTLPGGGQTESRVYSFWSESAVQHLQSSKKMDGDKFERTMGVEGVETDPETESIAAYLGVVAGTLQNNADITVAAIEALSKPEPALSIEDRARLDNLSNFETTLAAIATELESIRRERETTPPE